MMKPFKPLISLIVAMDQQRLIGRNNQLPWHISADLQYFKKITLGKPIIMGRKTHESIGRALPGRKNIVLTHDKTFKATGCDVVHSVEQALQSAGDVAEVMVMGGASLYALFLPVTDRLYITEVAASLTGDTWFPEWDRVLWTLASEVQHKADDKNSYDYCFKVLDRKNEAD